MSIVTAALMRTRERQQARFARTGFAESTLAELAWQHTRDAAGRWSGVGLVVGALVGLIVFAPAAWLAAAVASATGQRLLLTDARGTLWNGSALPVLSGGPGSRDASALPGRLEWQIGWRGLGLELRARQSCCLRGEVRALVKPGFGRMSLQLLPGESNTVGQWPTAWLSGLGTPWNTLQLGGTLRLTSPGLTVEWVQGRVRFSGEASLDVTHASSRVATLDTLGSYRLVLRG
ncbi:MAG: type II secretion system protein N, partial [Burkholderiaceae bacterium]